MVAEEPNEKSDRLYGRASAVVDTSGKTVRQSLADLKRVIA